MHPCLSAAVTLEGDQSIQPELLMSSNKGHICRVISGRRRCRYAVQTHRLLVRLSGTHLTFRHHRHAVPPPALWSRHTNTATDVAQPFCGSYCGAAST